MKYHVLLHIHPRDSILIGSEQFAEDDVLSCIPRDLLREISSIANVAWVDATSMTVSDLIHLAREKYADSLPHGATGTTKVKRTKEERQQKETEAIALLLDPSIGPNATEISKQIGVARTTLLGWPNFKMRYDQLAADATVRRQNYRTDG